MTGGENAYVNFGYESAFKTPAIANKTFGTDISVKNLDIKNNIKRQYGLGTNTARHFSTNRFEGSLGVDFAISDPWFLKGLLGSLTTSGSGPYGHYFFVGVSSPPSMTIINGIGLKGVTSNAIREYNGCIVTDGRISIAEGDEPARCSLTIAYAQERKSANTHSGQILAADEYYPWTYGSFEYPGGSAIANTESVELSIVNNAELKWGLGSRTASRRDYRQRDFDISTTNYFDDPTTYLEKMYGYASGPITTIVSGEVGCNIILDNGLTSSDQRKIIMFVSGCVIEHHSLPQSVEAEMMETVDIMGKSLGILVINNTDAMP